jgi:hypothetical protein
MLDKFFPSLKYREHLEEIRFDRNSERYVIPMHRKNVWTNKCVSTKICSQKRLASS